METTKETAMKTNLKKILEKLKSAERSLWDSNKFDLKQYARQAVLILENEASKVNANIVWDCGHNCPRYVFDGFSFHGVNSLIEFVASKN